ncbi:MAG TPA: hypothetical protein DCL95_15890 [Rhodospirillaceae bacterium]|jgi:hypothetical protein|nr:hypothetical protein [Rhodospirillaceae bacterium]MAY24697.1 hypothetical protein [Polycyclovorans sp.]MAX64403.1 hypothetical protein [Rhodospirillaceae bacterium]MBB58317.1 hypothetical protein [Rhodospirillaceae bacterium]HAE03232.1 hypothetical protein [Rhodospirillaceae bacterium]|tara:strand:- start:1556 stop:1744 length:189 start_codon:yes stop_codon:yes gene_type:complete
MADQVSLAQNRLFGESGLKVKDVKLFPGSSRDVSEAQFATEINKVLSQLEAGDYDVETDKDY